MNRQDAEMIITEFVIPVEEYGFLMKKGDKYISNIIIDEPDEEIIKLHDEMYDKATNLYADELYDALTRSGLLNDESIWGRIRQGLRKRRYT